MPPPNHRPLDDGRDRRRRLGDAVDLEHDLDRAMTMHAREHRGEVR